MRVLLTNDDGRDSPLFSLLVNVLRDYADLSIAVPAREQSWQGKSMTRHGHVGVEQIDVAGHPAWSIDGTPADCVNIALYNLLEARPDLVVSGINIGVNAGVSLVWASGTVGACLEANIAGIPGIALSQQLSPPVYQYWDQNRSIESATLARLDAATRSVMTNIWRNLVTERAPTSHATTWNVNLPFDIKSPDLVHTYMGHSWYQQCFTGDPAGGFRHRMQPFERDTHFQSDHSALEAGKVSVSLLDIKTFGVLPEGQQ